MSLSFKPNFKKFILYKCSRLFFLFSPLLITGPLLADENNVTILRDPRGTNQIKGLYLDKKSHYKNIERDGKRQSIVLIKARFERKGWNLFYKNKWIYKDHVPAHEFYIETTIEDNLSSFQIHSIGPEGEIERETILVKTPSFSKALLEEELSQKRRSFFIPTIGVKGISFNEIEFEKSNQHYQTIGVGLNLPFGNIGIEALYAFYPLNHRSDPEQFNPLDVALHTGYYFNFPDFPWKVGLEAGLFYSTIIKNKKSKGYENVLGFEIKPIIQKLFRNGHILGLSGKLSSKKIGGGVSFIYNWLNRYPIYISAEYERWDFHYKAKKIDNESYLFSIGRGFSLF